ncbi:MAG: TlyA family RNA methyltransferase [Chloroflexi bacterium]|nr:MAG: TlyA family RNA methyltransferase [Chloroflexota bacterium]
MAKRRIDTLLVDRGLAASREKAQALVMAGQVRAGERPVSKAGALVEETAALAVAERPRYVSRGGEKLEHGLRHFGLDVSGLVCADVGSSTGGFTDCLLQHGASRVYAIDVGKGQLDWTLRQDPRVVVMEGSNVRELVSLPERVDVLTIDVSFISLRLVLPVLPALFDPERRGAATEVQDTEHWLRMAPTPISSDGGCCAPTRPARGSIIALLKPQFEAEKGEVPRGGVIRDPLFHSTLIGRFIRWCVTSRFRILDLAASPILGDKGNREFLFWLRPPAEAGKPHLPREDLETPRGRASTVVGRLTTPGNEKRVFRQIGPPGGSRR